jgi:hypothetical protein
MNFPILEKYTYICGMAKKYEEYMNSPYKMDGVVERKYMTKADESITVDPETGQYYTMRKISIDKNSLHDGMTYTKLFTSNVGKILSLPYPALKIIIYGMSVVRPLQEVVVLNSADVCLACGIASSTFYNNIYELLDRNIISKKLGSNIEFWFDPNIFFNGKRIKVYKL